MRARPASLTGALLLLAACGPETVAQAERNCLQQARLAERPRGTVELGIGSGGRRHAALDLEIASDFLLGRDPADVWQACVVQRSGQLPTRPYTLLRN
ncbi:MAG: hypothetical protein ACK4S2_08415 [Gemmobacter sp.]|uniref:hypothetical protein n=1 Tax=Gemmobacter sp. TaxID=1898957 RepID=UPI00391D9EA4